MKRITAIIAAFVLTLTSLAACGNSDTPTSEVNPDSFSGTAVTEDSISSDNSSDVDSSVPDDEAEVSGETDVTDDDPSAVTTTADDDKTVPTTTTTVSGNDEEKPVTTTAEDKKDTAATTTSKKVTTTVKETTTKKPTTTTKVTTTKKQTTTTKKQTTTTKVTTKKKESNTKGTTMWVTENSYLYSVDGHSWNLTGNTIKRGDKVTAYETITLYGTTTKVRKIKTSAGKTTYINSSYLSSKEIVVKLLTQSDIDKLVKEAQEYSDEIFTNYRGYAPSNKEEWYSWAAESPETYEEYLAWFTPEKCSWIDPLKVAETSTYKEALKNAKDEIDGTYELYPDAHVVVYARWCPNGEGCTDEYADYNLWDIYSLH